MLPHVTADHRIAAAAITPPALRMGGRHNGRASTRRFVGPSQVAATAPACPCAGVKQSASPAGSTPVRALSADDGLCRSRPRAAAAAFQLGAARPLRQDAASPVLRLRPNATSMSSASGSAAAVVALNSALRRRRCSSRGRSHGRTATLRIRIAILFTSEQGGVFLCQPGLCLRSRGRAARPRRRSRH